MRLQNTFFLTSLVGSVLLVGTLFVLMQWSADRGMLAYLNTREAGNYAYALSAQQTNGTRNCGPNRQITNGWETEFEYYRARGPESASTSTPTTSGSFAGGTFTAPRSGVYHVCMSARGETGLMDITLRKAGVRIAAIGTDLIQRLNGNAQNFGGYWSSHSICRNVYMALGQQLTMWMEGGQSTDCTAETSFTYNTLDINLVFTDVTENY